VPLENDAVNECWIADRDRFSYEAFNSDARNTSPMLKQGGQWKAVDWQTALEYVANGLKGIKNDHGAAAIGALASATSTSEELHLLARLVRGLGSDNIDHRLRHSDARQMAGTVQWLGTSIASLSTLDRALVIGSFLRKDHPLFAQRLRQAARRGAQVTRIHAVADDWKLGIAAQSIVPPSDFVRVLAEVAAAVAMTKGVPSPFNVSADDLPKAIALSLLGGSRKAILLGNAAAQHPQAADILAMAQWIGEHTGATVGFLGEAGNRVGAQLVGAQPQTDGLAAGAMLAQPRKAYLLFNTEPVLDAANGAQAAAALAAAEMVVSFSPFATNVEHADVLLPIAPFTETGGSFVNADGRMQSFHGVVKPLGDTRPGWKVLRVLGNLLGLAGFDQETVEEVRSHAYGDVTGIPARLSNHTDVLARLGAAPQGLQRLADVPIYATDATVRRAPALQRTADAHAPVASVSTELWGRMGLQAGAQLRITQMGVSITVPAHLDDGLPAQVVRLSAGVAATATLGDAWGTLTVEPA
jgi:NADH-quinone oxidoreductase subunit G